jgi:hypothetical protein
LAGSGLLWQHALPPLSQAARSGLDGVGVISVGSGRIALQLRSTLKGAQTSARTIANHSSSTPAIVTTRELLFTARLLTGKALKTLHHL